MPKFFFTLRPSNENVSHEGSVWYKCANLCGTCNTGWVVLGDGGCSLHGKCKSTSVSDYNSIDIASHKKAFQSSLYIGISAGILHTGALSQPGNAVSGNHNNYYEAGGCCHTEHDYHAWLTSITHGQSQQSGSETGSLYMVGVAG
jgi:hypothetical protein